MKIASAEALARLLAERLAESGEPGRAITVAQLVEHVLPYPLVRERLGLAGKAEYDLAVLRLLTDRVLLQLDPALHEAAAKELDQPEPDLRPLEKLSESLLRVRDPARAARRSLDAEVAEEPQRETAREASSPATDPGAAPVAESPAESDASAGASVETAPEPPRGPPAESRDPESPAESRDPEPPEPEADRVTKPAVVSGPAPSAPPGEPPAPPAESPPAGPRRTDPPRAVACWSCEAALPMREGVRFCPHCGVDQQATRCTSCGDRLEPGWSFCPRCGRALDGR